MPREIAGEPILANLGEHVAARAWRELDSGRVKPRAIITLKEQEKSTIYRLEGVGLAGSNVIGKRCKRTTATLERAIYEDFLPQMPMPSLHYYGFVEEEESEFCWLFVEDACGMEFSPCVEQHRILAAQWLGTMHTFAADSVGITRLPGRGAAYYLRRLQSASNTIIQSFDNPELNSDDLAILKSILSQFGLLESRWSEFNTLSREIPRTLVHGDFVAKNMYVRAGNASMALFPFDWEFAGYGMAFTDLAQSPALSTRFSANPDLNAYWAVVHNYWPCVRIETVKRLANFGTLLRLIMAINWAAQSLAYEWVEKPMSKMQVYDSYLAEAIRALDLED